MYAYNLNETCCPPAEESLLAICLATSFTLASRALLLMEDPLLVLSSKTTSSQEADPPNTELK